MEFRYVQAADADCREFVDTNLVDGTDAKQALGWKTAIGVECEPPRRFRDCTDEAIRLIEERQRLEPSEGRWRTENGAWSICVGTEKTPINRECIGNAGNLYRALRDIDPEHELIRKIQEEAGT